MKQILLVSIFTSLFITGLCQTSLPYYKQIQDFHKQDSISFPAKKTNLLIGSSSFTMWRDVQEYFPGKTILNRAFGGSTLEDLTRWRYDAIFPYTPKKIIMYCGENDFANNDSISASTVVGRFTHLFLLIRARFPKVPFVYVSMKPSPSRRHLLEKYKAANAQIAAYLRTQPRTAYVDVYSAMLNADGTVRTDIFLGDKLHMNKAGYKIWQRLLKTFIK